MSDLTTGSPGDPTERIKRGSKAGMAGSRGQDRARMVPPAQSCARSRRAQAAEVSLAWGGGVSRVTTWPSTRCAARDGQRDRWPSRALRLAPESTDIVGGVDSSVGRFLRGQNGVGGALVRAGVPAGGRPGWAAGHPYAAAGGGMMGFAVRWPAGAIRGATTPGGG